VILSRRFPFISLAVVLSWARFPGGPVPSVPLFFRRTSLTGANVCEVGLEGRGSVFLRRLCPFVVPLSPRESPWLFLNSFLDADEPCKHRAGQSPFSAPCRAITLLGTVFFFFSLLFFFPCRNLFFGAPTPAVLVGFFSAAFPFRRVLPSEASHFSPAPQVPAKLGPLSDERWSRRSFPCHSPLDL